VPLHTSGTFLCVCARRRSHLAWAPPHKIFLLKNFAPAFNSQQTRQKEGWGIFGELFLSRAENTPSFFLLVRAEGVEWNTFEKTVLEWKRVFGMMRVTERYAAIGQ
jgi:hypothetical protein